MPTVNANDLPLESLYRWERERAAGIFLTQPFDGGKLRQWTWAEAADEVRRMAAYLKAQPWEPGSRIAILAKNCGWWILADLAIWMAGHVSVPVYPSLKAHSARLILEHSGCQACFLGAADDKEMAACGIPDRVHCICFPGVAAEGAAKWDAVIAATPPLPSHPTRPEGDLATIIYTSGTTGNPKGVMHSFAAFTYNVKVLARLLDLQADQRVLSYLPLAHIVERIGVEWMSLFLGSRIFFTEGVETFIADLHRAKPTVFLAVPRLLMKFQQNVFAKISREKLEKLLQVPMTSRMVKGKILHELGLDTVRHAACGAAPLPPEILIWFRELGLDLGEGYGMTETLITHLPKPGTVRPGYVGGAVESVEARIAENGELQVRSPMNMLGYYQDPEASKTGFLPDGFFRTGDLAEIAADGQLRIVGRIKEQFKTSKGKYVAPAPVESRLASHSDIEACCLMGAGMPNPFAVALLNDHARKRCSDTAVRTELEKSLQTLLDEVNAQVDPHERVAFIALVDGPWTVSNGLMTPTLKLKRTVLEGRYQGLVNDWNARNQRVIWESTPGAPQS